MLQEVLVFLPQIVVVIVAGLIKNIGPSKWNINSTEQPLNQRKAPQTTPWGLIASLSVTPNRDANPGENLTTHSWSAHKYQQASVEMELIDDDDSGSQMASSPKWA